MRTLLHFREFVFSLSAVFCGEQIKYSIALGQSLLQTLRGQICLRLHIFFLMLHKSSHTLLSGRWVVNQCSADTYLKHLIRHHRSMLSQMAQVCVCMDVWMGVFVTWLVIGATSNCCSIRVVQQDAMYCEEILETGDFSILLGFCPFNGPLHQFNLPF